MDRINTSTYIRMMSHTGAVNIGVSPRGFDKDRDGLVLGEGATVLILESYAHAKARGAKIYAEIVGFATNTDGSHIVRPQQSTMETVMQSALTDAETY